MISQIYKIDRWLVITVIGLSFTASLWSVLANDIINNDGIEYIKSARAMLEGDWAAATLTYKWPFYAGTMAFVSLISGLSLTVSAYIVNAFFYAWVLLAFLALVRLLGGDRTTLWFAALTILAFPAINQIRPLIIRDPVYIALFMSGCYAFLVYLKERKPLHNVLAIACFVAATLFRIEGLIYLFATQLYIVQQNLLFRNNRLASSMLLGTLALITTALLIWWQFEPNASLSYSSILTDPVAFLTEAWRQGSEEFYSRLDIVSTKILVKYSEEYAFVILFWSALSIVLLELAHTLYYLYGILWAIAWRKGLLFPEPDYYRPWKYLIFTALLIFFGFVMSRWFLAGRYPMATALLILLATPFLLAHWNTTRKNAKQDTIKFWLAILLIVFSAIKGLDVSTKKHYLKDAADWLRNNVEEGSLVYTNNRLLAHYYGRDIFIDDYKEDIKVFYHSIFFARDNLKHDYAAVNIKQRNSEFGDELSRTLGRQVLVEFVNTKGSRVLIFDLKRTIEQAEHETIYSK